MTNRIIDVDRELSDEVRGLFRVMPIVAENSKFFNVPTMHFHDSKGERLEAVRRFTATAALDGDADTAMRFTVEAQLEALIEVIETVEARRPEMFRETERARDLIDNLYLLNSPPT